MFRNMYVRFAARCALVGAVTGALLITLNQFWKDYSTMGLDGAWDMFAHLAPWEYVSPGMWAYGVGGGAVVMATVTTLAFWFAESPRWNK